MANKQPVKQHVQKDGTIWEWEETPELRKFIESQEKINVLTNS
jgi:hypothetical protein